MTAQELIEEIKKNNDQAAIFQVAAFDEDLEDVEIEGKYPEFEWVDSRTDSSEFWCVVKFIQDGLDDIYLKFEGEYDSYGSSNHDYYSTITEVTPQERIITEYKEKI